MLLTPQSFEVSQFAGLAGNQAEPLEECTLDTIRELPPTEEGVIRGFQMIGLDNVVSALDEGLHLPPGQHVRSCDAHNTARSMHVSFMSDGPRGSMYHDAFIDVYRPFPEKIICLLGKLAYSHGEQDRAA